jgi:hypothetical protein
MEITLENKIELLREVVDPILAGMAGFLSNGRLDAEDVVDFFALAVAAVMDHNDRLVTPQQRRLAGEFAAKRVQDHLRTLKGYREETGGGLLADILRGRPEPYYRG